MRFLWLSAMKDLLRYRRDAVSLGLWFVLPLVIAGLIGMVFGREDVTPRGLLLIADEDHGVAGTFLRESISRGPLGSMLAMQQVERVEGRKRIDRGDGSALLIIPKGYDRAVMRDDPAQWTLITNPELSVMPRVVREVASANVSAASYLQQIAGSQLRSIGDTPLTGRSLAGFALDLGRSAGGVATYLNPPRIRVKTTETGAPAGPRTVIEMLFPGVVLLVVLTMSTGMSLEIWKEAGAGAVRRVTTGRCGLNAFLAGKVAATGALLLAAILLTFAAARLEFGVPMRACATAIVWSGWSAVVLYCALLLAQLWLASERTATTVGGMLMVPLAMLGGSFFPIEAMPESFAKFAAMTPNGWMLVRLRAILSGPVASADLARDFAVLAAAGVLLFVLVRRRMEGRLGA